MKHRLTPTLSTLVVGAIGFVAAAVPGRWGTAAWLAGRAATSGALIHKGAQPAAREKAADLSTLELPAAGTLDALTPEAALKLHEALAATAAQNPARRAALLAEVKQRAEPECQTLLSPLLIGWAYVDPTAAAEWTLNEPGLGPNTRQAGLWEIAQTWALKDGLGLAHWLEAMRPGSREGMFKYIEFEIGSILLWRDPLAMAQFQEMPCMDKYARGEPYDKAPQRFFESPAALQKMATAVQGHVAYQTDGLLRHLEHPNFRRHADHKSVWNILFEQTAVTWHRDDPAACDAWLATFPENAQTAARHFIAKDGPSLNRSAPDVAAAAEPTNAGQPIPPQQRLTAQPPGSGPAEDAASTDWSGWWRADASAAEAFLNTAAWSDDQKFRARAKAYSSAP